MRARICALRPPISWVVLLQSDILTFLKSWAARPLQVAAIAPSGRALADLMTREIGPFTGLVIELGPGTGVFTRKLLARGVVPEDLTLIEYGADFTRLLRSRFPDTRVLQMDAGRLNTVEFDSPQAVGAVVSGLPLLSMPPRKVMAILSGAFGHLRTGAAFYQFTYGPRCPVPRRILDRLGLKASVVGKTLLNAPPATVYRITRRRPVPSLAR
jgi:phosphatidylethanolamine/phosphatidyl-N-methylethanolamine N-methyltransferase